MRFLKIFLFILLFLITSCEKEGVYFDEYDYTLKDSTVYVMYYYVYCENEVVYEEKLDKIYSLEQLEKTRDSLEEIHKDKFDWFYIETR